MSQRFSLINRVIFNNIIYVSFHLKIQLVSAEDFEMNAIYESFYEYIYILSKY